MLGAAQPGRFGVAWRSGVATAAGVMLSTACSTSAGAPSVGAPGPLRRRRPGLSRRVARSTVWSQAPLARGRVLRFLFLRRGGRGLRRGGYRLELLVEGAELIAGPAANALQRLGVVNFGLIHPWLRASGAHSVPKRALRGSGPAARTLFAEALSSRALTHVDGLQGFGRRSDPQGQSHHPTPSGSQRRLTFLPGPNHMRIFAMSLPIERI
jgi:hypothetical protein